MAPDFSIMSMPLPAAFQTDCRRGKGHMYSLSLSSWIPIACPTCLRTA